MTADHVDAVPRPSRGTVRVRRALWVVRLGVWCSVIAGWFVFFAPVGLGGGTTFTIVQGASMQPALYDGDLVLTRQQDSYRIGDLIVYPIDTNKAVIHRIIDGNATDGWITQGDNNDRPDAWKVPNDGILGKYWFMIPDVGHALEWLRKHPLYFGALVSGVVILLNLVRRRSRPHPLLAAAVAEGRRGPRLSGRPVEQVLVFVVACLSGVLSFISLILLFSAGILLSPSAGLMAAILLGSVLAGHWLLRRLADGRGVPEPTASQYVLGTRCWDVDDLPTPDHVLDVPNARALRDLTEKRRMAVLR
ncbi:MAG: signal peptidase I, partial [Ilumatobacteraceae bacterium]